VQRYVTVDRKKPVPHSAAVLTAPLDENTSWKTISCADPAQAAYFFVDEQEAHPFIGNILY